MSSSAIRWIFSICDYCGCNCTVEIQLGEPRFQDNGWKVAEMIFAGFEKIWWHDQGVFFLKILKCQMFELMRMPALHVIGNRAPQRVKQRRKIKFVNECESATTLWEK